MAHSDHIQTGDPLRAMFAQSVSTPLPFDLGELGPDAARAPRRRQLTPIDPEALATLTAALSGRGLDLRSALACVWATLLARTSGQSEVYFAVAAQAGRLPLRASFVPGASVAEWAAALRDDLRAVEVAPRAALDTLSLPPFDSAIACGAAPGEGLALVCTLRPDAAELELEAASERFDDDGLRLIGAQTRDLLLGLAADLSQPVQDFIPPVAAERAPLAAFSDDEHATVAALFRAEAQRAPSAPAVRSAQGVLSYAELDARSDALARRLVAQGVRADTCVALCIERSEALIVALLAILKAGGAYLPIEPSYPAQRVAAMLQDARPVLALSQASLRTVLPDTLPCPYIDVHAPAPAASDALPTPSSEDVAYVLYTSGSTGTPKGVQIPHRAIERLVKSAPFARLAPDVTTLHAAPVAFDASTFEIWGPLLNGGSVALHDEAVPTAKGLARSIREHGVTTMWLTAGLFNAVIDDQPEALSGLRELLTGGEALSVPHVRRALAALPHTTLINGYGPTETTTFATCYTIPRELRRSLRAIPIGAAIRDTELHVLDEAQRALPLGWVGELYIAGRGVARGYLRRDELTAERFLPDPRRAGAKMYRTGDLVRMRPDGVVEYLGRADQQVKIRGFRIELGEVENALKALPSVQSAVVLVRTRPSGEKVLVAYAVARAGSALNSARDVRHELATVLPEYMVPSAVVWLSALPTTLNGKLDTRALPEPGRERPELPVEYLAPRTPLEATLARAWADALDLRSVGVLDNLFDLGANSLLVVRTVAQLEREQQIALPVVQVFAMPTVAGLAGLLEPSAPRTRAVRAAPVRPRFDEGVAIVGMSGRFPGATSVSELWQNLCAGRETVSFFAADELDPALARELVSDPRYVPARGVLSGVDLFDAAFFGITPREAELMDPQQRVLLEVAWEALENAGYSPDRTDAVIGVFAGKYNNSYYAENVLGHPELIAELGAFQTMVANEKDYIATRIAHRLGLRGPAISVHTACSTSLVAVVQAYQNLILHQCDMALAGGVSITVPVKSGHLYQEGAMLSGDGHTRSFDASATGTVFSDGAAMVVLKRLSDARADGDTIYGVIRGAATNNDGGNKASFTAPSSEGQAAVIALAHAQAGVSARDISYVEAHGTATPLGDPIEVEALTRAFRLHTDARGYCALGSLKSNLGHLVIAAGVTGLIKTALSLSTKTLVPSLHFERPNPKIDFESSPFVVNDKLRPWPDTGAPRLAGVSSFGVGGTNAHVVLEEPPPAPAERTERTSELLVLSARSEAALAQASERLAAHLEQEGVASLADVAHTLRVGRKAFAVRRCVTADSHKEAARALRGGEPRRAGAVRKASGRAPRVALMFPGQGAQFPDMGKTLYREQPVFRAHVDAASALLLPVLGEDLRALLFPAASEREHAAKVLAQTSFTQPALFVVGYALAKLWEAWGVTPSAMIGHSVGEFVCAVLAGVMRFEDALTLVAERGRLMQAMPSGAMLSVRAPAASIAPGLSPRLSIASENAPSLCVVAGPSEDVEALRIALEQREVPCRLLQTSHAFHSSMMDPVVPVFRERVAAIALSPPRVPFVSTATGTWIDAADAVDPDYWARHLRAPVLFAHGVKKLLEEPELVLLEAGPRGTLATLARQQVSDRTRQHCLASMGDSDDGALHTLLAAAGQLWSLGVELDEASLAASSAPRRVPLPSYPFERKRFWVEPVAVPKSSAQPSSVPVLHTAQAVHSIEAEVSMSSVRREAVLSTLADLLEEASGLEVSPADANLSFVELGLDSLFLTQFALALGRKFKEKITFRQLLDELPTMEALAEHIARSLPAEAPVAAPVAASAPAQSASPPVASALNAVPSSSAAWPTQLATSAPSTQTGAVQRLIEQQLQVMQQQLALLAGGAPHVQPGAGAPVTSAPVASAPLQAEPSAQPVVPEPPPALNADEEPVGAMAKYDVKKAFGAIARITVAKGGDELTPRQKAKFDAFVRRYNDKTKGSKKFTQENRQVVADPRVVTGFRPAVKELIYPIVVDHSRGSRLFDIDGNEYVDALNGFGLNLFGWQPEFVTRAVEQQLRRGHEVGPQHPLQAEVAKLICEFTGFDRAAFCNTGSEAVMGCARIARTVTGRSKIAIFTGGYHGIFDEVVVRGTKKLRSIPAAPGIMPSTSENVLVLDYGTEESLAILKERAQELAAIIVEPVQSRRPDFQPREFIHALRELTTREGIVLVFDEVVTGFRTGPGGAQEFYGVKADLASYGKVVGGGLPIGVIAGTKPFMDALDGGHWEFGDESMPPVGVTYFAGTFVRHPLALAAAKAVLTHLKEQGPGLQRTLNAKTTAFADDLNVFIEQVGAPIKIKHFASLWKTFYTSDQAFGDLLFFMMRDRGVHIYDGFPCFFTTAHSDEDFALISTAFKQSVLEMQDAGFLPERKAPAKTATFDANSPPAPGARLGRDPGGNPAWYVPHPSEPNKYVKLEVN